MTQIRIIDVINSRDETYSTFYLQASAGRRRPRRLGFQVPYFRPEAPAYQTR